MLKLSQTRFQVKQISATLIPNPNHPAGQALAYRQLKENGWACANSEVHETDRVPVFRLGAASIRRNRTGQSHWLLEIGGETRQISDVSVAEITEAVQVKLAEIEAAKLSPAAIEAAAIAAEYPELAKRVELALALVEQGVTEFPKYETEWQNLTKIGNWVCKCPDARNRDPRANFGTACKHTIAGEIARRLEVARKQVAYRKLSDSIERSRARFAATQDGYDAALRPDPANRKGTNAAEIKPRFGWGGAR